MVLIEILKAKEKSVMTKREVILLAIKTYVVTILVMIGMFFFVKALSNSGDNYVLLDDKFFIGMMSFMAVVALATPGAQMYLRWKRWDRHFPKTLYVNPKTRAEKMPDHYEESIDVFAYVIAMDESYEHKLKNMSDEDREYFLYLLDSYYGMKWLDRVKGPYEKDYE